VLFSLKFVLLFYLVNQLSRSVSLDELIGRFRHLIVTDWAVDVGVAKRLMDSNASGGQCRIAYEVTVGANPYL
jgi:hypothetical protein